MIDPNGRYKGAQPLMRNNAAGEVVAYLPRRFLPKTNGPVIAHVEVTQGQRLDLIAFRWRADATRSWEIADANLAMDPFELTDELGRTLIVTQPNP